MPYVRTGPKICRTPDSLKVSIPKNSNLTKFTDNNFLELKQLPYHFHKNGGFVNVAMAVFEKYC